MDKSVRDDIGSLRLQLDDAKRLCNKLSGMLLLCEKALSIVEVVGEAPLDSVIGELRSTVTSAVAAKDSIVNHLEESAAHRVEQDALLQAKIADLGSWTVLNESREIVDVLEKQCAEKDVKLATLASDVSNHARENRKLLKLVKESEACRYVMSARRGIRSPCSFRRISVQRRAERTEEQFQLLQDVQAQDRVKIRELIKRYALSVCCTCAAV